MPPGESLEIIAALDVGGSGLDLSVVDGNGESSLTRSRYLAADRLCASSTGRPGSIELRLANGKADALVLVRPARR